MAARRYCWAAAGEIAAHAERVADQDMDLGRARIVRLKPAGAGQRLVAEAAGEQSRDQPNLGRAVAWIVLGGAADGGEVAVAERVGRGERAGLRPGGAGEVERSRGRIALPRQRPADQR